MKRGLILGRFQPLHMGHLSLFENVIEKKEKICKEEESDYKKFLSLGFPKTAIEKFNFCMKEQ